MDRSKRLVSGRDQVSAARTKAGRNKVYVMKRTMLESKQCSINMFTEYEYKNSQKAYCTNIMWLSLLRINRHVCV